MRHEMMCVRKKIIIIIPLDKVQHSITKIDIGNIIIFIYLSEKKVLLQRKNNVFYCANNESFLFLSCAIEL